MKGKSVTIFRFLWRQRGRTIGRYGRTVRAEVLLSVCALRNSIHIYLETVWSLRSLREKNKGII